MQQRILIQERRDRYVDARMAEIRAVRAEQEAREKEKADRFRQSFERDGGIGLLILCMGEHDFDDDDGHKADAPDQ